MALDYSRRRRFKDSIHRAMESCSSSGNEIDNHFAEVGKMVQLGSDAEQEEAKRLEINN